MSLQFIAGPCGSGKTHFIQKMITERAEQFPDRNFIILVPEQYNLQTQRAIVAASPRKGIMNIDVLSFMRISHRIFDEAGAGAGHLLEDTAKSMILRRVASLHEDELTALASRFDRAGYIDELKSLISEFMQYDIHPEDMDVMIDNNEDRPLFNSKLKDLKLIYGKFIDYLGQNYITHEEILDRASALCSHAPFLEDAELYLDGFTGFTPIQLRFLSSMLCVCKKVVVTVILDESMISDGQVFFNAPAGECDLFSLSKNTVYHLTRLARECGAGVDEHVTLVSPPFRLRNSKKLTHLSQNIFRDKQVVYRAGDGDENSETEAIRIAQARTIEEECAFVCRRIHELVRSGCRYSDFAVLCGSLEDYHEQLSTQMVKYGIPAFIDLRHELRMNPLSEMVDSVVEMITSDFSYQSVIRFLRCRLTDFTPGEVRTMENYITAAGIRRRSRYVSEWKKLPRGYKEEELEVLNGLRQRFAALTEPLVRSLPIRGRANTTDMVTALYGFIKERNVYEKLMERAEVFRQEGDIPRYDEYRQIYGTLMELFDNLTEFLGTSELSVSELGELIDAGLSELSVGILPPGTDQVMVGDIKRSRLNEVSHLFLMGVNDGLIPAEERRGGILSDMEREILREQGIQLAAGMREEIFIQRFYLYMYLSKAGASLCLSYSLQAPDGSGRNASSLVPEIRRLFPEITVLEVQPLKMLNDVLTREEALEMLASKLNNRDERRDVRLLLDSLARISDPELLRALIMNAFRFRKNDTILASVAAALYGERIVGSVTRLESFASCAYAHFLKYGLRLREKQEFSFEMRDLGTIYHAVLQEYGQILSDQNIGWRDVKEEKMKEILNIALDRVLSGQKDMALYDTSRSAYMETRIRRVMERTVAVLSYQIGRGDFEPERFEMSFRRGALKGIVDRVDIYREGSSVYLRIVDYKTGAKTLDITSLYEGVSLQLALYAGEAVQKISREERDRDVKIAGMFYYRIADPLVEGKEGEDPKDLEDRIRLELRMNGTMDRDAGIIGHMDRGLTGRSDVVNVQLNKDGTPDARSKVRDASDLECLGEFARLKAGELEEEILSGRIEARPYKYKNNTACDYCRYASVCMFDERIEGCEYKEPETIDSNEIMEEIRRICGLQSNSKA